MILVKTRIQVGKRVYKVPKGWKFVSLEGWGEGYVQMRIQRITELQSVVLQQTQPNTPVPAEVPVQRI